MWCNVQEGKLIYAGRIRPVDDDKRGGNIKNGLKNSLYYFLLKAADILQGEALMLKRDAGRGKVEELEHFMKLLCHNHNLVMQSIASRKCHRSGFVYQSASK